jgi:putative phosphoribosyl transferase
MQKKIEIFHHDLKLDGILTTPESSLKSWVIFAHGSGSSHQSPRNNWMADELNKHGYGTLLFDLLTTEEDLNYSNRFNIPLLANRLTKATEWLMQQTEYSPHTGICYFGASTGAAAALRAAANASADLPLTAIVSRGGRPDLAGPSYLKLVKLPTLLIVGDLDYEVIRLNMMAQDQMENAVLNLVSGATHLFEEPGTLEQVLKLTLEWFNQHPYQKTEISEAFQKPLVPKPDQHPPSERL